MRPASADNLGVAVTFFHVFFVFVGVFLQLVRGQRSSEAALLRLHHRGDDLHLHWRGVNGKCHHVHVTFGYTYKLRYTCGWLEMGQIMKKTKNKTMRQHKKWSSGWADEVRQCAGIWDPYAIFWSHFYNLFFFQLCICSECVSLFVMCFAFVSFLCYCLFFCNVRFDFV